MVTLHQLEKRVLEIENRNDHVESDKAWELSFTRRILLVIFTYLSTAAYLYYVLHAEPWLNSIGPALGFLLSTLTLPYFKTTWERYIYKKK